MSTQSPIYIFIWVVIPLFLGGLVSAINDELTTNHRFVLWTTLILLSGIIGAIFYIKRNRVISAPTYMELVENRLKTFDQIIRTAKSIDLLGGTLHEFTRKDHYLEALSNSPSKQQGNIRILILHPYGFGVKQTRDERICKGREIPENKLEGQILESIICLVNLLGLELARKVIKLHKIRAHYSLHRFDNRHIVTSYNFGQGGSSPTIHLYNGIRHSRYCKKLQEGFDSIWENSNPEVCVPLTEQLFNDMKRDFSYNPRK